MLIGLLSLLSCISRDHLPRGGTAQSALGPLTSFSNQQNVPQACPKTIWLGYFVYWGSIFSNDSRVCQLDLKLVSTMGQHKDFAGLG